MFVCFVNFCEIWIHIILLKFLVTLCHLSKVYDISGDLSTLKCVFSDKKLLMLKLYNISKFLPFYTFIENKANSAEV